MSNGTAVELFNNMSGKNPLQNKDLDLFLQHFAQKGSNFNSEAFMNLCEDTNEDTVMKILAHFNENLREGLDKIQTAQEVNDCETIWKAAHKIAGSAELLGFKHYADTSRDLSRQMRANPVLESHQSQVTSFLALTRELEQNIKEVVPEIKSFL